MGQLFKSPINNFSALMAKLPEVHTKWCQVPFKKRKQEFEIYIILSQSHKYTNCFAFPEGSEPTTKKTFQKRNNSATLVMQQPKYPDYTCVPIYFSLSFPHKSFLF